jgi:hypothetical protein
LQRGDLSVSLSALRARDLRHTLSIQNRLLRSCACSGRVNGYGKRSHDNMEVWRTIVILGGIVSFVAGVLGTLFVALYI